MGDGGRRTEQLTGKELQKKQPGKEFLKHIGRTVMAGSTLLAAAGVHQIAKDPTEAFLKAGLPVGEAIGNFVSHDAKAQEVKIDPLDKKTETPEEAEARIKEMFFPGLSPEEKVVMDQKVAEARAHMETILTDKDWARIASHEGEVWNAVKDTIVPEEVLMGIMVVESHGDLRAESQIADPELDAKGLTQMLKGMAQSHALATTDLINDPNDPDERYIPDKILPATASELAGVDGVYRRKDAKVNWSFPITEWHMGRVHLEEVLILYANQTDGVSYEPVAKMEPSGGITEDAITKMIASQYDDYRRFIDQNKVNVHKMYQVPAVRDYISGDSWNDALDYPYRVVASALIFNDLKRLGELDNKP